MIEHFEGLKKKLELCKEYLNNSKKIFADGGHVLNGVPLANSEFIMCIEKIDNSISNLENLINRYTSDRSKLYDEKNRL